MPLQTFLLNEALLSTTLEICRLKNNSNCFWGRCDFAVCQFSPGYRYNYGVINSSFCSANSCQYEQFKEKVKSAKSTLKSIKNREIRMPF